MSSTSHSGPLLTGSKRNGTVGFAVMAQAADFTVADTGTFATSVFLPANSALVGIEVVVGVGWNSSTSDALAIGTQANTSFFAEVGDIQSVGLRPLTASEGTNWINVGTSDVQVYLEITSTGTAPTLGSARVNFLYLQNFNG